ncbi:MAG: hypothetical protein M5U19_00825 [Microthrixaceae bacterium]|nr:hypothetical protein [Microthrixaceae bacterium]
MSDTPIAEALEWIREAGELTLSHFRSAELSVSTKGDGSPVTQADHDAEALLRERIGRVYPDDAIVGEEHPDRTGSSGRSWVIDPIDGTRAFSHGVGTYSNLLALTDEAGTRLGVINLPALGETIWAVRGEGCWINGNPARAERRAPGAEGRVLCVTGFHDWDPTMFERVTAAGVTIRTWGDAYGYALVATGRADAMFDPHLEWWDLAAPALVVTEAGGTLTRRDGSPEITVRRHDGPYALSAIASADGDHDFWVDLLGSPEDR